MKKEIKFKRNNIIGILKETQMEKGPNYKWTWVLAFLDENGRWLYTDHWRLNGHKKATELILSLGYELI